MKMRTILTLIISLAILFPSQAQKTNLELKLEQGKEYKQKTNSKSKIIQDFNGQNLDMEITIKGTMAFFVKRVNESDYEMDVTFKDLALSMQLPQGLMEFSSENTDPNDVFSTVLGAMKNKSFGIVMSKTGKVVEVSDVEALWNDLIDQFDQVPTMQKQQIKTQIANAYGAKALKGSIEMVTAIYPDNPVNKGDKWSIKTNLESGMSAEIFSEYNFVDLTSDYASIKGNSTLETADKEAYIQVNGMPLKYDLKGAIKSEIKVDKKTGWIIEATINQEINGTAYVKENPQMPNGMKIPMTIQNEMVITN